MPNWIDSKKWSDKFTGQIQKIIGEKLVKISTYNDDAFKNTDLIIYSNVKDERIMCRIRRYKYFLLYKNDFTLRYQRKFNITELEKILKGFGDKIFYGFANIEETAIQYWFMGDLNIFRNWYIYYKNLGIEKGVIKKNNDRSSDFKTFNINDMPTNFFIEKNY